MSSIKKLRNEILQQKKCEANINTLNLGDGYIGIHSTISHKSSVWKLFIKS